MRRLPRSYCRLFTDRAFELRADGRAAGLSSYLLLVTLVAAPHGQEMLFPLTGATIVMAVMLPMFDIATMAK